MPTPTSMRPLLILSSTARSSASRIGWLNGSRQTSLDGLGLARSHAERIRAAGVPGAVALADACRWADQRFQIDPLVGHGGNGFVLVAGKVQFLDAFGGVAEAPPDHDVVVKILGPVT